MLNKNQTKYRFNKVKASDFNKNLYSGTFREIENKVINGAAKRTKFELI